MDKLVYENVTSFKRGQDPKKSLDLGIARYTKNAQIYWYPAKSVTVAVSGPRKGRSVSLNRRYWIVFPEIKYRGFLSFAKKEGNNTVMVEDHTDAEYANISWHRKITEDPIDGKISKVLEDWTLKNIEELMNNSGEAVEPEYIDMITV